MEKTKLAKIVSLGEDWDTEKEEKKEEDEFDFNKEEYYEFLH